MRYLGAASIPCTRTAPLRLSRLVFKRAKRGIHFRNAVRVHLPGRKPPRIRCSCTPNCRRLACGIDTSRASQGGGRTCLPNRSARPQKMPPPQTERKWIGRELQERVVRAGELERGYGR